MQADVSVGSVFASALEHSRADSVALTAVIRRLLASPRLSPSSYRRRRWYFFYADGSAGWCGVMREALSLLHCCLDDHYLACWTFAILLTTACAARQAAWYLGGSFLRLDDACLQRAAEPDLAL